MRKRSGFLMLLASGLLFTSAAQARWQELDTGALDVDVIADYGGVLPTYPVRQDERRYRAYLQAERGDEYSIRVRNRSDRRVGVVIAVDGRNIISGRRSDLQPNERMYILGPYQSATYRGWRSGRDQVNRFYFTDAGDSYAGRWGDHSAMGVIAVAAFAERPRYHYRDRFRAEGAPSLRKHAPLDEPGTGFGQDEYSPSRRVAFDPEPRPFARYFYKYEWRETLCRRGVIDCRDDRYSYHRKPGNRFWPDMGDAGYAPYPPGFRRNR